MSESKSDENNLAFQENGNFARSLEMEEVQKQLVEFEREIEFLKNTETIMSNKVVNLRIELHSLRESWTKSVSYYQTGIESTQESIDSLSSKPKDNLELTTCNAWMVKLLLFRALEEGSWMKPWMDAFKRLDTEKLGHLGIQSNIELITMNLEHLKVKLQHLVQLDECAKSFSLHDRSSVTERNHLNNWQKELKLEGEDMDKSQKQAHEKRKELFYSEFNSLDESIRQTQAQRVNDFSTLHTNIASLQEKHKSYFGIAITF
jgi:hypothetical protein